MLLLSFIPVFQRVQLLQLAQGRAQAQLQI